MKNKNNLYFTYLLALTCACACESVVISNLCSCRLATTPLLYTNVFMCVHTTINTNLSNHHLLLIHTHSVARKNQEITIYIRPFNVNLI